MCICIYISSSSASSSSSSSSPSSSQSPPRFPTSKPLPKSRQEAKGKKRKGSSSSAGSETTGSRKRAPVYVESGWYVEVPSALGHPAARCKSCGKLINRNTAILRAVYYEPWVNPQTNRRSRGTTASSYCLLPLSASSTDPLVGSTTCFGASVHSLDLRTHRLVAGEISDPAMNALRRVLEVLRGWRRSSRNFQQ